MRGPKPARSAATAQAASTPAGWLPEYRKRVADGVCGTPAIRPESHMRIQPHKKNGPASPYPVRSFYFHKRRSGPSSPKTGSVSGTGTLRIFSRMAGDALSL
ncbi:hypothetical protein YDYSY3_39840 [Paenibacillus chitinolyticus]|nr:hypothetical protein YDYSY3_39840 [Paenibacillus chitinolyticus]